MGESAELAAARLQDACEHALDAPGVPGGQGPEPRGEIAQHARVVGHEELGDGLLVEDELVGEVPVRRLGQLEQGLRSLLECRRHARKPGVVARDGDVARLHEGAQVRGELRRRALLQVVRVQPVELLEVEDARRLADVVEVEGGDEFLAREDLLVAVRPPEPGEEVDQRIGVVAEFPVGRDRSRGVALGEPCPVHAEDLRQVGEARQRRAERAVDVDLLGRVGEVVVAADHVGNRHVGVVHRDAEVVGRRAVAARDHEVLDLDVGEHHAPLDRVLDHDLALERDRESDRTCDARGRPGADARSTVAIVGGARPGGDRGLAPRIEILGRTGAVVGRAALEQSVDRAQVVPGALGLEERALVPVEPEPAHGAEDLLGPLHLRALAVGVLDAQDKGPAVVAGVQPVEERRANAAHVKGSGGARSKARPRRRHSAGASKGAENAPISGVEARASQPPRRARSNAIERIRTQAVATAMRKRILVVEDNEDNRRILLFRLRKLGDFEIVEANDGAAALASVETHPPDLIFMDLKMPVMDGWEATRRIRETEVGRSIPIIALTAQAMAGDEQKALAQGCDDYLAKPIVDPDVLRTKVERFLGSAVPLPPRSDLG